MNCPKCGSDNVSVQVIQTAAKTSQKGNGCLLVAIKAPARQRSKIRPSACVRTAETAGTSDAIPYLFICPAAPLEWRGLLSASCGRVEAVILEPYRRTAEKMYLDQNA